MAFHRLQEQFDLDHPDYVYEPRKPSEIKRRGKSKATKKTKEAAVTPGPNNGGPAGELQAMNNIGTIDIGSHSVEDVSIAQGTGVV
ncbi:hypothetical protein SLS62_007484 [Diatrype stigma]|uniref:Uncharacterized protein n=1 Tax=Diatrype stigma TaxID=117547 RepID=A0AAN9UP02_9PEZI